MAKLSDIKDLIDNALKSKIVLEAGAEAAIRAIPTRTRLGKGVSDNLGPTNPLPALKNKTVRNRTRLKKIGQLTGPGATPKKSGLNKSGTLLDSLEVKIKPDGFEITVPPQEEKKVQALLKIDSKFQFMRLSAAEFNRVVTAMTKQVEQVIKKIKFTDL